MAHDAGGHGGHEAGTPGLPQLDVSTYPSQLFWLALCFGFLYLVFSKKTLPDISGVLENRKNHIASDLDTADKLRQDAENAQAAYEDSLNEARTASSKAVAAAHEKKTAFDAKKTAAFNEKEEGEIKALESRLQKAKQDAMDDMNTIAAEVAREAAEKIVGISTDLKQAQTVVKALNGREAA